MNRRGVIVSILGTSSIAGCIRTEPGEYSAIDYDCEIEVIKTEFRMDGQLEEGGGAPAMEKFEDVKILLFSKSEESFLSKPLGDLSAGETLPVSVTSDRIPHYVVFDSPDFWGPNTEVTYFQRLGEQTFSTKVAAEKSDISVFSGN